MKPQKLDPVQTYEKAIGAKALSEKKLEALAAKMKKNSKKLRMSFTQGAMWIPLKITKDYQVRHSDWALMDLAEEANLGLFAAVDHLPERKSSQSIVKFITGWVETSLDEAIRQIAEQTNQNKPTSAVPKAMKLFQTLEGEPCALKYRGVRTTRSPSGEEKIHLTAVPFGKDGALAKLASAAQTAGEPLLAFVVQGDPDEDLEALLDNYKRKIGKWTVNPYENVVITTFHPECRIKTDLSNAPPTLKKLVTYIEKHYLLYKDLPTWGKTQGFL